MYRTKSATNTVSRQKSHTSSDPAVGCHFSSGNPYPQAVNEDDPIPADAYQDPDWLQHLYHDRGLSQPQIADACGVSNPTVSRWMHQHDFEVDGSGGRPALELVRRVREED